VNWTKPELVAEIEFAGWTGAGLVRQAAFKGLREDKPAAEVDADKAGASGGHGGSKAHQQTQGGLRASNPLGKGGKPVIMGVSISNPDKALWPDAHDGEPVTKLDLARYLEAWTLAQRRVLRRRRRGQEYARAARRTRPRLLLQDNGRQRVACHHTACRFQEKQADLAGGKGFRTRENRGEG
jgi:hypothetical protein